MVMLWLNLPQHINGSIPGGGGGGEGALDFHVDGGGGGMPLGVENLSQYTLLKMFICIPCRNIAPSLVPDRGPVIHIVGWEALGSNHVINGVARQ